MGLKAVEGCAVTGEVLDGQQDRAFNQALIDVLEALNECCCDFGDDLNIFAVGTVVTAPAGVGYQVDLVAVDSIDTASPHALTVQLGVQQNFVSIAITDSCCCNTFVARQAVCDGVGEGQEGNGDLVVLDCVELSVLLQTVVEPNANFGGGVGTQNEGSPAVQVQAFDMTQVIGQAGVSLSTGTLHAGAGVEDLFPNGLAVLVNNISSLVADRAVGHEVDQLLNQLLVGHCCCECSCTGVDVYTPVFKGVQFLIVVQVTEELAVDFDNTQQGNTDGGAVCVLIELGLQNCIGQCGSVSHRIGSGMVSNDGCGISSGCSGACGCGGTGRCGGLCGCGSAACSQANYHDQGKQQSHQSLCIHCFLLLSFPLEIFIIFPPLGYHTTL